MYRTYRTHTILLLTLLPLFLISCGSSRQTARLDNHKSQLTLLAEGDKSPQEKLDVMMLDFTKMMHESLDILNPKKGIAYVKLYGKQNEKAIRTIMDQVGVIPEQLNTLEMLEFTLGLVSKPYMSEFLELLPRFQRKYNQLAFVLGLTSKVKNGLKNLGLKTLGL